MHIHSPSWFLLSTSATAHISLNAFVPAMLSTVFALVTVCARWYSRIVCRPGHVGAEDWCVSGAMVRTIFLWHFQGVRRGANDMADDVNLYYWNDWWRYV